MPATQESLWRSINSYFEIGIEILRLMEEKGEHKGALDDTEVEKIADGVLLISNDKEILIAVNKDTAQSSLSESAVSYGIEKGGYLCYIGAASAIPMYELSRANAAVKDYIVSDESLRATLCGNYPEYVKTYNMSVSSDEQIEYADAPPYLFLQKQLDFEADNTRNEVSAFQESEKTNNQEFDPFDEEWVLEG